MGNEFERALRLMRRHDPQLAEDGFDRLREIAVAHVDELIVEFGRETKHALRCWVLELIGQTRSPRSFDLLVAQLQGEDEALRGWAERGLRRLDTKESRRVLWQHEQTSRPGWLRLADLESGDLLGSGAGDFGEQFVAVVDPPRGVGGLDRDGAPGVDHADVDTLSGDGQGAA